MKNYWYTFIIFLSVFLSTNLQAQKKLNPNLIVYNAKVYTLDNENSIKEAIAVENGKIILLGKNDEVLKIKNKKTQIINANGRTIIPGIFDSHSHVIRGGRFYNTELRWDGVKSLKRALQMLKEQAQRTPKGQWVRVVGGWSAYQFEEKRLPTLEEINLATGNVPTFILHLYGHAYLNKSGLEALNINSETPSPKGGLIQKDEKGNPTGLLVAEPNAFILYSTLAKLPELTNEEKINSTKLYMSEMNRLGVTSIMDAGGGFQNYPDDYGITNQLDKSGELTLRLPFYLFAQKPGNELTDYKKWISEVEIGGYCEANMERKVVKSFGKFDQIEYFVQGGGENLVSSAADFENFDQPRPDLSNNMEGQLKPIIETLVKNRWPFRLHATYDESITRFLNVIEEVNKETPLNNLLWFLDHAETISEKNLSRLKSLNGNIAIQFRMVYQAESFIKRYGIKAAQNTPPIKKMLDMGITVGMGSDGTRVSSYNPWVGLYWLTTGKSIGGTKHMSDDNILDRTTAVKLYTQGSAKLVNLHQDRGILKEGYLADFIVLSDNYFETSEENILNIVSYLTVLNGKVVYADNEFEKLMKPLPKAIPSWSPVNFYGGYQN
jgi:predicted amidohydrolase YtcJ